MKGFCTMLVPTEYSTDGGEEHIVWHVLFNEDGRRISFADPRARKLGAATAKISKQPLSIDAVETARHFVGWCESVANYAGMSTAFLPCLWLRVTLTVS